MGVVLKGGGGFQCLLWWVRLLGHESGAARQPRIRVSILVVVDSAPRLRTAGRVAHVLRRFQSLLSWIRLLGTRWRCDITLTEAGFNPCCRGFGSSAPLRAHGH